jgi:pilus assembly protein CpaE
MDLRNTERLLSLVASDAEMARLRTQELLIHNGLECPPQCLVQTEVAADRANRLGVDVVVLVLFGGAERGLETLREIKRLGRATVLVVGPAGDPQFILRALHAGADEYLDESRVDVDLPNALVRLRTRRLKLRVAESGPGRLIAVLGASGGSGASTIAANLSAALARTHQQVALLDLRLTAGDLASLFDLQPVYSLADLCHVVARVDRTMFGQLLVAHACGVHLLAAPLDFQQLDQITTKGVRQALALARSSFPFVVMDMNNAFDEEQVEALWQADEVLLALRLDYTSLRNARRIMNHLQETGMGLERVRVVVNRQGEAKQLRPAQAEEALGIKITHYVPDDPARVNEAINAGVPVVVLRPSAKVARSILELAARIGERSSQQGVVQYATAIG